MAGGSTYRLASMPDGPKLVLDACREGLKALRALGVAITPAGIGWLERIPPAALIPLFRRVLASPGAEVLMARHTRNAREEIRVLAAEVTDLVQAAGTPAPSLAWLCRFVDQPFVSDTA
ncbi:MAG TPA: hypothetical protein VD902_15330, partial [Symbiobacteriaceae bacterium]|nr:hypothetical protein [Symbiobacteriaceae bacterium]